jgi:DNA-binding MarR family transcriptional regulator
MNKNPGKPAVQAWIQLHRVHRRLLEAAEKSLKDSGLPPLAWYDVLLELHRARGKGLRQYEIGEKVLLTKHNLSRLLDRLEAERLVERHACAEDGRGNVLRITADGAAALKDIWPVYGHSIQENFDARLDAKDLAELVRILAKLTDSAADI